MKKLQLFLILGLFSLASLTSFAQEEIDYFSSKNEINIQVDNIFAKQDMLNTIYLLDYESDYIYYSYYAFSPFIQQPSIGFGYKRHLKNSAIRVKISMSTYARTHENDVDDANDDAKFAFHQETFSAGYELHSNIGRTQVFYGMDVRVSFNFSSTYQKISTYDGYSETLKDASSKITGLSYGVMPFLGFKYFISPKFSVSTEYHAILEAYTTKTKTEIEGEEVLKATPQKGFQTKFGPLGQITFSFHF